MNTKNIESIENLYYQQNNNDLVNIIGEIDLYLSETKLKLFRDDRSNPDYRPQQVFDISNSKSQSAPDTLTQKHDDRHEEEHEDFHVDGLPLPVGTETQTTTNNTFSATTSIDLSKTFSLHSNIGAKHTIYLDFDGHTTINTGWNTYKGISQIVTPKFDFDGNVSVFGNSELERIQYIWQRVAEDFLPFNVNVTTQDPGVEALQKTSSTDTQWGIRVSIGGSNADWLGMNAGGVAFINSFNDSVDTPAFVFAKEVGNGHEKYTAEAISHEVGHSLGLNHDGTSTVDYFEGYGSGATSWGSIMGAAYNPQVTQWSKGDYTDANNKEDDLSIITTRNGFSYRNDDRGDTNATASILNVSGNSVSDGGIIERNTDRDVFSFITGTGSVALNILPAQRGANLDILAELYNAQGNLIATSNPADLLTANFNLSLNAGQYFVSVMGTGKAGLYTNYGSLGQYSIGGSIVSTGQDYLAIRAADAVKNEGNSGATTYTFTVERTGATNVATSVRYDVAGSGVDPATADDFTGGILPSGSIDFAANETTKTITVSVNGDAGKENNEAFSLNLSNASSNSLILTSTANGSIVNDDVTVTNLAINDVTVFENAGLASLNITRSGDLTGSTTVQFTTMDGSGKNGAKVGGDYLASSGTISFAAGEASKSIAVSLVNDTTSEANENFFVNLSGSSGGTIVDSQGIITIQNDDTSTTGGKPRRGGTIAGTDGVTGLEERTIFVGTPQADTFVLGDRDRAYYDDAGLADYAFIKKFNPQQDSIELYGSAADYRLGSSPFNSKDAAIFFQNGGDDELIGIIAGGNKKAVSLQSGFDFLSV
jgi:hypothetical protein